MLNRINFLNHEPLYDIYLASFKSPERETRMIKRFEDVRVSAKLFSMEVDDSRVDILIQNGFDPSGRGGLGNFFNMIQEMEDFCANSTKEYIVIFENDVFLRKTLHVDLQRACEAMKEYELDTLLIGYLINDIPEHSWCTHLYTDRYDNRYYNVPDSIWGAHGFILTKAQAKFYIDKYTVDNILSSDRTEILSVDWVFTKQGRRAIIYPPLCVEEGEIPSDNEVHKVYHRECKNFQYNDNYTL